MRRALAALVAGLWLLAAPSVASATEATRDDVLRLAHDATFDDDALRRLRDIDEIDGRPVDLDHLLSGAEGAEVEQRVATLLQTAPEPVPVTRDAAAERAAARRIVAQDRYQPDEIPRPFRGPLEWIADRLEPLGNAIDAIFRWIASVFSAAAGGVAGGAATIWTLIGLVVVTIVAIQTKKVVERRGRAGPRGDAHAFAGDRGDDPRDLERRAATARAAGDHELAVRLLFRAGLLRLARARAIPARRSLTTGEIRRLLGSPAFDEIGTSFDAIAYGRRPATESDSDAARTGWSDVLNKVAG